eukprot:TRINITY_DN22050_c0_g1_i3.p1 TRINITY_DN22050_c0_g1~~TRINITY_DN22050_c0_g1_i3.p1  ORF type:complete len:105 (+),score=8.34 TRINITY_DN22050_c0_g1_i3:80-394(+)
MFVCLISTVDVRCLHLFFFLMIRRPPRSTLSSSSAASDVYKRQEHRQLRSRSRPTPKMPPCWPAGIVWAALSWISCGMCRTIGRVGAPLISGQCSVPAIVAHSA